MADMPNAQELAAVEVVLTPGTTYYLSLHTADPGTTGASDPGTVGSVDVSDRPYATVSLTGDVCDDKQD